eukprot:m51a1_g4625 hypothetical protein (79) ;mRNA; f:314685-314921
MADLLVTVAVSMCSMVGALLIVDGIRDIAASFRSWRYQRRQRKREKRARRQAAALAASSTDSQQPPPYSIVERLGGDD